MQGDRSGCCGIVGAVTFSILACDRRTGEIGVATFSFALAVGARVPLLHPGFGGAAVQAGSPAGWRTVISERLTGGSSAADIIAELRASDNAPRAQVAIIDARWNVAAHSGNRLQPAAGEASEPGVVAIANLMQSDEIPAAALEAFHSSAAKTLAGRLLDALTEADRLGGDIRGRQSAALIIAGPCDPAADLPGVNLRVDDSRDPVGELDRLHRLWEAHELIAASRGADGLYRDPTKAQAAAALVPDDQASLGAAALALLRAGRTQEARPYLHRLTQLEPRTPQRLARLVDAGLLDRHSVDRALH